MKFSISRFILNRNLVVGSVFLLTLFAHSNGYCGDFDAVHKEVNSFLFGSMIRKIALTLGLGAGLFQSFMSGTIRPLLIYGGLGLAVCFLPNIIESISSIGVVADTPRTDTPAAANL